jgi:hypothetical protein
MAWTNQMEVQYLFRGTTTTKIAFLVEGSVQGQQTHVIGRCGDHAIKQGAVFRMGCRYKRRDSLEEFASPPQLLENVPVSLQVLSVHAYGKPLEKLGPGMTGSLVLRGDGHRADWAGHCPRS